MSTYSDIYNKSWALCIGINKYKNVSPLEYAVNDSKEIAKILIDKFNFNKDHVFELYDKEATKSNIFKYYMKFSHLAEPDDRIIVFFAGHGHTIIGTRGEIGFLVPYDGDINDNSSLLRWDELTRNSELIIAKHIFFILDACFSGLALTRALPRGSMRFLNDMLTRYSRQVVTAGKANQTVSDSGGPIPEHSIFTGHLIDALSGKAVGTDKVITANGIMSYLYEKVSKDYHSYQTPHYGYFDGDGDLILNLPTFEKDLNKGIVEDRLIEVPVISEKEVLGSSLGYLDKIKEYISDQRYKIKLDDQIVLQTKNLLSQITPENFPLDLQDFSEDVISNRLLKYEDITLNIRSLLISLSNWGNPEQKLLQLKIISRLCDHLSYDGGLKGWIALRWYPLILFMYEIGIPYLINSDYKSLFNLFHLKVTPYSNYSEPEYFIRAHGEAVSEINSTKIINKIKIYERNYVPFNEYLFKSLQPLLEDILFIGKSYEYYFDRLEILIGLIHADLYGNTEHGRFWGPLGRYAWKYTSRFGERNPFTILKNEAFDSKDNWEPLKAGFFKSSFKRFENTINEFEKILKGLGWY